MKMHYPKILLFFFLLNILVTSYQAHNNNNEPHTTSGHTPIYISRMLSECDIESSNYDNDTEMKSVKENFDRQTSQRFEEYEERMKDKRQKRKEERDKKTQEIIEKDKMEKSLSEKVEKGCLRCGCGLGGVAASVGLFGGLGIYGSKTAAIAAAKAEAMVEATAKGLAAGAQAGKDAVIVGLQKLHVSTLDKKELKLFINTENYTNFKTLARAINTEYNASSCVIPSPDADPSNPICPWVKEKFVSQFRQSGSVNDVIETAVKPIVSEAQNAAKVAEEKAIEEAIEASTVAAESTYVGCQTAIIASVVAIIIIALVMIIIYLVLSYRRKKKMNRKAEYTKLLKE
ncbi:rifin PIR protein,putative [Plasmodium sp. DRC-Itaito]|nr:rifin PIR protein,putative [Plasmodium sp. DRC-Itaito]